jgi:hypothetical protein
MLYGDQARRRGITTFLRAAALNDDPPFLDALAAIVEPRLRDTPEPPAPSADRAATGAVPASR